MLVNFILAEKVSASLGVKVVNNTSSYITYDASAPNAAPLSSTLSLINIFPLTFAFLVDDILSLRMLRRDVFPAPEAPMM